MQQLIASLEKLGLAKAEALVYVDVLQNASSNGSQITKRIGLPKPTVYLALEKLYQRGLLNLIPGKNRQYLAQDPKVALENLRGEFNQNLDLTLNMLSQVKTLQHVNEFIHINGYNNFLAQFRQILLNTTKELYLHTNMDLNLFQDEFSSIIAKGVRVIVYAYGKEYNYNFLSELYFDPEKPLSSAGIRFLAVADYQECLIADGNEAQNFLAVYTQHQLQISLVSENIHNAIYWLKLQREHPGFTYPCRLQTLAEQDIHMSGYII